jgi:hypothetical protein
MNLEDEIDYGSRNIAPMDLATARECVLCRLRAIVALTKWFPLRKV